MPLETSTLEVVANGGLAEDVNPRVLQPGSWIALENVAPDRGGELRKRNGSSALDIYTADGDYVIDNAVNSCPLHVGNHAGGLFCLQVSPQDGENGVGGGQFAAPPFLATLTTQGAWLAKDDVSPFLVNRVVGLRSHQDFVGYGVVKIGIIDYVIGVPTVLAAGATLPIILRGIDSYTGAVVQDDLIVGYVNSSFAFSLGFSIRTMATHNGRIAILYCVPDGSADSGIVLTLYEPISKTFGTATVVATRVGTSCPSMSLPPNQGGVFESIAIAYGDDVTLRICEWQIGSVSSGAIVTTSSYTESGPIAEVEISARVNEADLYVSYTVSTGEGFLGKTRAVAIHETAANAWSTKWGPTTIDATHRWNFLTHGVTKSFVVTVGRDPSGTISAPSLVYAYQNTLDGLSLSTERLVGSLVPMARPAEWRGKLYLPTLARGDSSGGSPYVGAIVHLRTPPPGIESSQPGQLVGTFGVGEVGTPNFTAFRGVNYCAPINGSGFQFAAPIEAGIKQSAVDLVHVEAPDRTWLVPTISAQGLTILPGALTSYFDGQSVCELGFLEAPVILSAEKVVTETVHIANGTYLYTAVWEYYDAVGLLHYSQPSPLFPFAVSGGNADYVKLTILTDRIGRRASDLDGERRPVRLVVYRTKVNSSGPFYRLMSPTIEQITGVPVWNDYVVNERYLETIEFRDNVTDNDIDDREYGFFPFDANGTVDGRLNSDPPPPSRFALAHKSRVWLVSGDNPREVWFSQLMESGYAPMFSKVNRFYLSDTTEEIVALAGIADRVLIFTTNRIYAIDGDGPDNRGNGIPFREPYPFSLTIGCTSRKSVVATNDGVAFLHGPKLPNDGEGFSVEDQALYLVTQDLQVKRISGPVQETLAQHPLVRWSLHVPLRGWVLWGLDYGYYDDQEREATTLLWSYWTGTWSVWRTPQYRCASATVWQGGLVTSLTTDIFDSQYPRGSVYREGGYSDPVTYPEGADGAVPQWITMKLITPWLHMGALASYSRTRRVQVFGEAPDPDQQCKLNVALRYDQRDAIGSTYAFKVAADSTRGFPLVRLEAIPSVQKSAAIQIEITDERHSAADAPGPGVVLSAISLAIAGKKGLSKLHNGSRGRSDV